MIQVSLNKLMETLGQSEPYFVKCIRSNAEKVRFMILSYKHTRVDVEFDLTCSSLVASLAFQ